MLAPPPQILCGLGEEAGEPIFSTSSRLQVPTASPHLHLPTYKVPKADEGLFLALSYGHWRQAFGTPVGWATKSRHWQLATGNWQLATSKAIARTISKTSNSRRKSCEKPSLSRQL